MSDLRHGSCINFEPHRCPEGCLFIANKPASPAPSPASDKTFTQLIQETDYSPETLAASRKAADDFINEDDFRSKGIDFAISMLRANSKMSLSSPSPASDGGSVMEEFHKEREQGAPASAGSLTKFEFIDGVPHVNGKPYVKGDKAPASAVVSDEQLRRVVTSIVLNAIGSQVVDAAAF